MNSILTSDIFFFITSFAVIIVTLVFVTALIYLVRILRDFKEMSERIKNMVQTTEEEFEDISRTITESWIFKFLFGKKKPVKKP